MVVLRKTSRVRLGHSLEERYPAIAAELHPTKNGGVKASEVAYGSGVYLWWRCAKNPMHEWETSPNSRTVNWERVRKNGKTSTGCPYCGGRKVAVDTSLRARFPEVAAQWHPTRNGKLLPSDVLPNSHKVVYWQCPRFREHVWKASIKNRTRRGDGCSKCGLKTSEPEIRLFAELQSLFSSAESRARIDGVEVDVFLPTLGVGVEYDGVFYHRSRKEQDQRKNDFLAKKGVQLVRVREAGLDRIAPHDIALPQLRSLSKSDLDAVVAVIAACSSERNVITKCDEYRSLKAFAADAIFRKYLAYLPDPFPEHSLKERYQEVCKDFDYTANFPLTPANFSCSSNRRVRWRCSVCGYRWPTQISNRTRRQSPTGCPKCSKKRAVAATSRPADGESLEVKYPSLAAQWHPTRNGDLRPSGVKPKSNRDVWWQCPNDPSHAWKAKPSKRTRPGSSLVCPECTRHEQADKRAIPKPGCSLAEEYPDLVSEWNAEKNGDLTPADIAYSSNRMVWWKCRKSGHEYPASPNNRTGANKTGCPYCSGQRVAPERSLAAKFPDIALEWHPDKNGNLTPQTVTYGSERLVWWRCLVNHRHEWQATVNARTQPYTRSNAVKIKSAAAGCLECKKQETRKVATRRCRR